MRASQRYLVELADEFLALMVRVGWDALSKSAGDRTFWGETTWIDPRDGEPGVDVSTNFRRVNGNSIEIQVVAHDSADPLNRMVRTAEVAP